jgi:histidyl-tRNA synthetase
MHDILPIDTVNWQYLESVYLQVLASHAYQEIRMPILEQTQLFKRSVGEVTDIVEKEMYTFLDRNDESVTLRPEGTAGCVRAAEQNGLLYNQVQRLFYSGPMFRYERPQKGRLRQFHQLGVEAFGIASLDIELEMVMLSAKIFEKLGLLDKLTLEINSIGDSDARAAFGSALVAYLQNHKEVLDEDSVNRLNTNPLRVLDSKIPQTQNVLKNAPILKDYLSEDSQQRFEKFKSGLTAAGITFQETPSLVRGLDYYNDTVFEWTTEYLGAQATVCAGGRYDTLAEKLGAKATPAVGFAMGKERLILMLETLSLLPESKSSSDIFIVYIGEQCANRALQLAETIRNSLPQAKVLLNCGGGSMKSQMKKADKSGADVALIIGEQELSENTAQLKFLRERKESKNLAEDALLTQLVSQF